MQVEEVSLTGSAAAEWGPRAYESTLQLITGRTHQIRAQLAAEGCPLLGDTLYEALQQRWQQEEQQQQQESRQQHQQQPQEQPQQSQLQQQEQRHPQHGGADWCRVYQLDPLKPIGLQAHKLRIRDEGGRMREQLKWWRQEPAHSDDDWVEFSTGDPWWRRQGDLL